MTTRAAVLLTALVLQLVLVPEVAIGEEELICWTETKLDEVRGRSETVTVCRIVGSDTDVVYGGEAEVPARLWPNLGFDQSGTECWFWVSRETRWVMLRRNARNVALLGWDPDGVPGGALVMDARVPACTSLPQPLPTPQEEVWSAIREYVHQRPIARFNPDVGRGVAGMATFLEVSPPVPLDGTLLSPGTGATLEFHAEVSAAVVDWGDGTVDTFTAATFPFLTGYPDGVAFHSYEAKTCVAPGQDPRCHPTLDAYPIEVSYEWTARWRVVGSGGWQVLTVPATAVTVDYPVTEIVGVLTG